MAAEELIVGNWGRRAPIKTDPQQMPVGTDMAGQTVQTNQGDYVMQGPRSGVQVPDPIKRLPPTVATTDNPLIVKGAPVALPTQPDQREVDIMVKKAKNENLADDDLRFLAERELAARTAPSVDEIANMNFDQRLAYSQKGFNESRDQQMNLLDQFGQQQQDVYGRRIADAQAQMDTTAQQGDVRNNELLKAFEAEQRQFADMSKQEVIEAGQEGMETLQRSAARRGMQRSSATEGAVAKATQNTQKLVSQIELATNSAIREYQVNLLDKMEAKMEKLQDRVTNLGDAAADAELGLLKEKQKTYVELMSQDPSNPQNMIALADKLKSQQLAELKENRELQKDAAQNLQWAITTSGSAFLQGMSAEEIQNLAANTGMNANVLANMGQTLKEEEAAWEKSKYSMDKEYDWVKFNTDMSFRERLADKSFEQDLTKLGIQLANDQTMEIFKTKLDAEKYANLGYGNYANSAVGIVGDGNGLFLDDGTQVSPQIKNAAPVGSQKRDANNNLVGECAYEAGRMVTKPGTNQNMVYGMNLQNKKDNLAKYVQNGQGFYGASGQAKVGNSVITNESKTWGHVAIINEIRPDGSYVLSEYNRAGKKEFSNSRVVPADSPFILGVIDTKPNNKYQVAKDISKLATDVISRDPMAKAGKTLIESTTLGKLLGIIPAMGTAGEKMGADEMAQQYAPTTGDLEALSDSGAVDEQGLQLDPQRKAVRSGAYTLPNDTLSKLQQYNPQAYQQYMSDLAYAHSDKKGPSLARLPANQVVMIEDAKMLPAVLTKLRDVINNPKVSFDPVVGAARSANPYDDDQKVADAQIRFTRQLIGKFLEGGVLRREDEIKYEAMLPKTTDTKAVALAKLDQLEKDLQLKVQGYLEGFGQAGYDVTGYQGGQGTPGYGGTSLGIEERAASAGFDLQGARNQGYTDAEISAYLNN